MDSTAMVEWIEARFGSELHESHAGGRQQMAEALADHLNADLDQALGWIDELERRELIHYVRTAALDSDSLLEAARTGLLPPVERREGYWSIGN